MTQRIVALEGRMDEVERTVVARLDRFEQVVVKSLAAFSTEEHRGRNIFRGLIIGLGIVIIGVLLYIDGN